MLTRRQSRLALERQQDGPATPLTWRSLETVLHTDTPFPADRSASADCEFGANNGQRPKKSPEHTPIGHQDEGGSACSTRTSRGLENSDAGSGCSRAERNSLSVEGGSHEARESSEIGVVDSGGDCESESSEVSSEVSSVRGLLSSNFVRMEVGRDPYAYDALTENVVTRCYEPSTRCICVLGLVVGITLICSTIVTMIVFGIEFRLYGEKTVGASMQFHGNASFPFEVRRERGDTASEDSSGRSPVAPERPSGVPQGPPTTARWASSTAPPEASTERNDGIPSRGSPVCLSLRNFLCVTVNEGNYCVSVEAGVCVLMKEARVRRPDKIFVVEDKERSAVSVCLRFKVYREV
jgi:hypothetical protein